MTGLDRRTPPALLVSLASLWVTAPQHDQVAPISPG
jgi:hypothetical protein